MNFLEIAFFIKKEGNITDVCIKKFPVVPNDIMGIKLAAQAIVCDKIIREWNLHKTPHTREEIDQIFFGSQTFWEGGAYDGGWILDTFGGLWGFLENFSIYSATDNFFLFGELTFWGIVESNET